MCDFRSTRPDDYVACDIPSVTFEGEAFLLHYNENHDWWFLKQMQKDEVILIKMFDSDADQPGSGIAKCRNFPPVMINLLIDLKGAPHTSFNWSETPRGARKRESLEIRTIVFT